MTPGFTIAGRSIGPKKPVYCIAELSANHNQKFEDAVALLHAAKEAGADAVKLQTYTPDTLTIACDNEYFRIGRGSLWEGKNLYDLYSEAYTPWDWQPELKRIANGLGLALFSTPFDRSAVDFLEEMDVPAYKIASFELTDLPLIRYAAARKKPLILSTGMAGLEEIEAAVSAARAAGNGQVALLKCTSAYPAPPEELNLSTIADLAHRFRLPVGLSDHSMDPLVPVIAVSLGACIVEKHLTLSRSVPGPDSAFSLEPHEFAAMVRAIRAAGAALGTVSYGPTGHERPNLAFRRSLFVVEDMKRGDRFSEKTVRSIRPARGLPPSEIDRIIGKRAARDIPRGTPLDWDLVGE